jgi:hypothetical protein
MQRTRSRWSRWSPSFVLLTLAVPMACEDGVPVALEPGVEEAGAGMAAVAPPSWAPGLAVIRSGVSG